MRKSSFACLAAGTKQTWQTAMTDGWKTSPMSCGGEYVSSLSCDLAI